MKTDSLAQTITVHITADRALIPMGRSVRVEAVVGPGRGESAGDYILLPFVNQRRWGPHERPDESGKATFLLPLPNPGPAHVQVVAFRSDTDHWMGLKEHQDLLLAGCPMPAEGIRSNVLELEIAWRTIPRWEAAGTLFCIQWEPWFTGGVRRWSTAQAVPLMGFYDSYNRDVIRQHVLWFMDLGVDFIMPDWSNHIWGCRHWNERSNGVNALLHATQLTLEVLAEMRAEGLPVPQLVLMPGLSNGRPATMEALNEELDWIYHNYLRNPRFDGLWQMLESKPLIVVLDTGAVADKRGTAESAFRIPFFKQTLEMSEAELDAFRAAQGPVDDTHFTVRWMSSQNQTTRHHELGYWSWMDGVIAPPVTYKDGVAEVVTVTPSFFNALGWTGAGAYGRRGGSTYLETFKVALAHRPKVIQLHQFNEYSGQPQGHGMGPNHDIYVDTYSVELSDDLEPVSLTAPGYRGDKGGWGFYYLNLTRALMDLCRRKTDDSTLLAVSSPARGATVSGASLPVSWSAMGARASGFTLAIDGNPIREHIAETATEIPLAGLAKGTHILTVVAEGARTRYPLSRTELDDPLDNPIPVKADVPFVVE
jgi:hypothetical protein